MTEVVDQVACVVLDREAVISVESGMAVVRISGKGDSAVYLGLPPERAIRIGAAFIRAGLKIDPTLTLQALDDQIGEANAKVMRPRAVEGGAA